MNAAELPAPQIGRILVAAGLLTEEQLAQALEEQERTGKRLGEIVVQRGFMSGPALANALAEQHGGVLKTEYGFASGLGGVAARRAASESGAPISPHRPPDPAPLPQLRTVDPPTAPASETEPEREVRQEPTRESAVPAVPAEPGPPEPEALQPWLRPAVPPAPEPEPELPREELTAASETPVAPIALPTPVEPLRPTPVEPLRPTPPPEPVHALQPLLRPAETSRPAPEPEPEPEAELPAAWFQPPPEPEPVAPIMAPEQVEEAPEPEPFAPLMVPEPIEEPTTEPEPEPEPEHSPEPVAPIMASERIEEALEPEPFTPLVVPEPVEEAAAPEPEPEPEPEHSPEPEPKPEPEPELTPAAAVPDDRDALIESLRDRVDAQEEEIATLREQLEQERERKEVQVHVWPEEQSAPEPTAESQPESYLLCVPTPAGYVLLDRVGVLPRIGEAVEVREEDGNFTVTKVVRLPRNGRPCAYLQRA